MDDNEKKILGYKNLIVILTFHDTGFFDLYKKIMTKYTLKMNFIFLNLPIFICSKHLVENQTKSLPYHRIYFFPIQYYFYSSSLRTLNSVILTLHLIILAVYKYKSLFINVYIFLNTSH